MANKLKVLSGSWLICLISIAGVAAASTDLRLVEAAQKQDKEAVKAFLLQHVDVNAVQKDGATALAWAAHWDDLDMADLLIRAGAKVDAANEYGATPLWLACSNGNAAMVDRLLKAGANPNIALVSGETALMAASEIGAMKVVMLLLKTSVDVNAKENAGGQTALMWALAEKHPDVARALIEHGAEVRAQSKTGFTALMFAAQQGDTESARMLLAAGADVNSVTSDGMTALLLATAGRREKLAVLLLDAKADPNVTAANGYTPLHYAASNRNMLEAVKALLAHGANPNVELVADPESGQLIGATPFFLAATAGNASVMQVLADNKADPLKTTTMTTFSEAGDNGRRLRSVAKTTPLMAAAGMGRYRGNYPEFTAEEERAALEAAKVAVELGDDVNAANEWGWTALHAAAYIGADSVIQFLLDKGARTEVMDNFGQTPLSIASRIITVGLGDSFDARPRRIRESTVNLLLRSGAIPVADSGVKPSLIQ